MKCSMDYRRVQLNQDLESDYKILESFLEWCEPFEKRDWLNVGCGHGTEMLLIDEKYKPKRMVGVDLNPQFIAEVSALGYEAVEGAQEYLGYEDEFNYYLSSHTLEHSSDYRKALDVARNSIRQRGHAYFAVPIGEEAISVAHTSLKPLKLHLPDIDYFLGELEEHGLKVVKHTVRDHEDFSELIVNTKKWNYQTSKN